MTDFFQGLLGYTGPAGGRGRWTLSREKHVEVDGKYADAVLGDFGVGQPRFVAAVEGKGPQDPLDRPFGGRRKSAVQQGYEYAINLECDWIIVTSMRETRLYHKGSNQQTYEAFDTVKLAADDGLLKKFVYLLGVERMVPATGRSHLLALLVESEKVGKKLTSDFYQRYAEMREDAFDQLCQANPKVPRPQVLASAQKLLNRVLFCAFSEDRGLLEPETVAQTYSFVNPYQTQTIWDNFRGLFRAVNAGNPNLKIPAYNGGLFQTDDLLDRTLAVPDGVCGYFRDLGGYDYRPVDEALADTRADAPTVIDVDILGHVFEQSISDLEQKHHELEGTAEPEAAKKRKSRRKREGAFYTPAFITEYIVEQALGGALRDVYDRLQREQSEAAAATAALALKNPRVYDVNALTKPAREALVRFWTTWRQELDQIRVLDPACGSGAFLIQSYNRLHRWHRRCHERLDELQGHKGSVLPDPTEAKQGTQRANAESRVSELLGLTEANQSAQRTLLDWLRVEHEIAKPSQRLQASLNLSSDAFVAEIRKLRGKKNPLTAAALRNLREEYAKTIEPARLRAVQAQKLEREISDLVSEAYGLTPDEVALMWKTAPPRMPIAGPEPGSALKA